MKELNLLTLEKLSIADLRFTEEPLRSHSGRPDQRLGFRLVAVGGLALPSWARLSYVVGRPGADDEYVYVVVWPDTDIAEPEVVDVTSEVEAKVLLLKELARQVGGRSLSKDPP